jgi:DNA-binding NtrC family response regulator
VSRCKLLIIDDVLKTRQSLQHLLKERYEVVAFASVQEGLKHLEAATCGGRHQNDRNGCG